MQCEILVFGSGVERCWLFFNCSLNAIFIYCYHRLMMVFDFDCLKMWAFGTTKKHSILFSWLLLIYCLNCLIGYIV